MSSENTRKAQLIELDQELKELPEGKGSRVTVQFNPDSLKLAFANQIQNGNPSAAASSGGSGGSNGSGGDQASGTSGRQFVGAGTTKLSVQLWFDVGASASAGGDAVDDVRRLTQKVIYFITPKPLESDRTKFVPPGMRFSWGSFIFDGLVDSIEESIEFFSSEGKPLRASIAMGMSQQTILVADFGKDARPAGVPRGPGLSPLTPAAAGSTLQGLAAAAGADWQAVAAANGIANPRQLVPGQLIDLGARPPRALF